MPDLKTDSEMAGAAKSRLIRITMSQHPVRPVRVTKALCRDFLVFWGFRSDSSQLYVHCVQICPPPQRVVVPQASRYSLDGGVARGPPGFVLRRSGNHTTRAVHSTIRQQPAITCAPASLMGERTQIEAIHTGCAQLAEHPAPRGRRASGECR